MSKNKIPSYDTFMNPIIDALKKLGGSGTIEEINTKACESFLRRCHENLWTEIQDSCKKYIETKNEEYLPDFIRWYDGKPSYVSIKTKIPHNVDAYMNRIKDSIENKKEYRVSFPTK